MGKKFLGLFSSSKNEKAQKEAEHAKRIEESHQALIDAATGTMSLAADITETLKDRIDDYQSQIEATSFVLSDALFMVDDKGIVETFNPAAERIFGWQSREIIGKSVENLFCLDGGSLSFRHLVEGFGSATSPEIQAQYRDIINQVRGRHKNEHRFYVDVRISDFARSDDSTHHLVLVRDISDLRRAQEELLESEEHFRAFGQASSEAMMIHGPENILNWNPRLSEMTGYNSQEISSMMPLDFVHPLEREKVRALHSESGARSYDTLFLTKQGMVLEVSINAKPVEWKNREARIKVIRDVTHIKDFEQILHISRERYRTITDNTIDLVCSYDPNLMLTFANMTYWEYFMIEEPEAGQHGYLDVVHPDDHSKVLHHLSKLTPMMPVKRTLHRMMRDGQIRWVDWIDRAIYDEDGNLLEYQSVGRDVTDYIERRKVVKLQPPE